MSKMQSRHRNGNKTSWISNFLNQSLVVPPETQIAFGMETQTSYISLSNLPQLELSIEKDHEE